MPYREIPLDPSSGEPPLRVYDPSGPYSCENFTPDLSAGLPAARPLARDARRARNLCGPRREGRGQWLRRGDRLVPPCPAERKLFAPRARRPSPSSNSRAPAIVTEEMIYVAHRENLCRERALDVAKERIADGESFGAEIPEFVTPEFVRARNRARARDHSGQYQSSRSWSR